MSTLSIVLLCILVVLIIGVVVLYFVGRNMQKKQEAQQAQIEAMKQTVSMLIIDKKRMKLKEAGLPQAVIEQTPKMLRNSKLPVVKAKVGPQIMTLISDEKIFESIPVKKEVKAVVSGIYITDVKGLRRRKRKKAFSNALSKKHRKKPAQHRSNNRFKRSVFRRCL